jgi:hypothetical protein
MQLVEAGADVVAGSYVFKAANPTETIAAFEKIDSHLKMTPLKTEKSRTKSLVRDFLYISSLYCSSNSN